MFRNSFLFMAFMLLAPEPEGAGGGGGNNPPPPNPPPPPKEPTVADLMARIAALEGKGSNPPPPPKGEEDDDLLAKAKKQREIEAAGSNNTKALEAALQFTMNSEKWLKDNAAILPKEISDIFAAANRENYESAIEKESAIKSGMLQSFFSVQSHMDILTPSQKNEIADYLKLTKNGKQEQAQRIYNMIFEPTFEMLKRMRKADALNKGHNGNVDDAYKQKLMSGAQKKFFKTQGDK